MKWSKIHVEPHFGRHKIYTESFVGRQFSYELCGAMLGIKIRASFSTYFENQKSERCFGSMKWMTVTSSILNDIFVEIDFMIAKYTMYQCQYILIDPFLDFNFR